MLFFFALPQRFALTQRRRPLPVDLLSVGQALEKYHFRGATRPHNAATDSRRVLLRVLRGGVLRWSARGDEAVFALRCRDADKQPL